MLIAKEKETMANPEMNKENMRQYSASKPKMNYANKNGNNIPKMDLISRA